MFKTQIPVSDTNLPSRKINTNSKFEFSFNSFNDKECSSKIPYPKSNFTCTAEQGCTNESNQEEAQSVESSNHWRNLVPLSRFKQLKRMAKKAIAARKTFTLTGMTTTVKATLLKRGWIQLYECDRIEKKSADAVRMTYDNAIASLPDPKRGQTIEEYVERCERILLSRLIKHRRPFLVWSSVRNGPKWPRIHPGVISNRLGLSPIAPKHFLSERIRFIHWFHKNQVAEVNFPRCFAIFESEELTEFVANFRYTACLSFVRYVVDMKNVITESPASEQQPSIIPFKVFEFALKRCYDLLTWFNNDDIDWEQSADVSDTQWNQFLSFHYLLTYENALIKKPHGKCAGPILKNAKLLVENIKIYWPQYVIDGYNNIWILKPKDDSCGAGIYMTSRLDHVLKVANDTDEYVVQKYVERPLTIYNTKGDFRQWFLVTSVLPLKIWMYTESYIRLSTQEYNLQDFRRSVHITNLKVQKNYAISPNRDKRIGDQMMWDSKEYQSYLRRIGQPNAWYDTIYPGMKRAIIASMLAAQDHMLLVPNNFEVFGADFIIAENLTPWLMEINVNPDFSSSTPVAEKLCSMCVDDIIKVVIDLKEDHRASTGNFELIYDQKLPSLPRKKDVKLSLVGNPCSPDVIRRQMYTHLKNLHQKASATNI